MGNRILYVDLLRIIATFSVVLLHVAAGNWGNVALGTFEWSVFNFYDSVSRFGVPIFVMISGMLLLDSDKKITIRDIYTRYITKIVVTFILWSFFYALYKSSNTNEFNIDMFLKNILFGHYHMWYLYMIVGLYIITPFIKRMVEDKKLIEYYLILSLLFTSIIPILVKIFNLENFNTFIGKFQVNFVLGYTGYYIGGYYLHKYSLNKHKQYLIYFLGIIGLFCTYLFTNILSIKTGTANSTFYSNFSPTVIIVSLAIFVFFKYEVSKLKLKQNTVNLVNTVSSCCFRVYLVYDFFIIFLSKKGISTLSRPVISVPITAIIVFTLSFIVSLLLRKIKNSICSSRRKG